MALTEPLEAGPDDVGEHRGRLRRFVITTQSVHPNTFAQKLYAPMRRALVPGPLVIVAGAVQGDGALITAAHGGAAQVAEDCRDGIRILGVFGLSHRCRTRRLNAGKREGRRVVNRSRRAAVVTWAYAAMFGVPAVPVAIFLAETSRLPSLWGLFDMYAGPWSSRFADDRVVALLLTYSGLVLAAVLSGWLLWEMRKAGAVLNLGLLPVEAVFWVGFALPVPWLFGIARVALVSLVWPELSGSRRQ